MSETCRRIAANRGRICALQREGVGLGMWIFLASEVLFFAALFCGYAVYRSFNVEAFRIAGAHTEIVYGSINTVLLLT